MTANLAAHQEPLGRSFRRERLAQGRYVMAWFAEPSHAGIPKILNRPASRSPNRFLNRSSNESVAEPVPEPVQEPVDLSIRAEDPSNEPVDLSIAAK